MDKYAEHVCKIISNVSYSISGVLISSHWLPFLNHNAAALGVIIGTMTFITNFIFQFLNHRIIAAKHSTNPRE